MQITYIVRAQYLEYVAFINRSNSLYVRQRFETGENVEIRRQLGELGGSHRHHARVPLWQSPRWASQVRSLPGIEVLTSDDPRLYCGITAFTFAGRDQQVMADRLLKDFNLFTTTRTRR